MEVMRGNDEKWSIRMPWPVVVPLTQECRSKASNIGAPHSCLNCE